MQYQYPPQGKQTAAAPAPPATAASQSAGALAQQQAAWQAYGAQQQYAQAALAQQQQQAWAAYYASQGQPQPQPGQAQAAQATQQPQAPAAAYASAYPTAYPTATPAAANPYAAYQSPAYAGAPHVSVAVPLHYNPHTSSLVPATALANPPLPPGAPPAHAYASPYTQHAPLPQRPTSSAPPPPGPPSRDDPYYRRDRDEDRYRGGGAREDRWSRDRDYPPKRPRDEYEYGSSRYGPPPPLPPPSSRGPPPPPSAYDRDYYSRGYDRYGPPPPHQPPPPHSSYPPPPPRGYRDSRDMGRYDGRDDRYPPPPPPRRGYESVRGYDGYRGGGRGGRGGSRGDFYTRGGDYRREDTHGDGFSGNTQIGEGFIVISRVLEDPWERLLNPPVGPNAGEQSGQDKEKKEGHGVGSQNGELDGVPSADSNAQEGLANSDAQANHEAVDVHGNNLHIHQQQQQNELEDNDEDDDREEYEAQRRESANLNNVANLENGAEELKSVSEFPTSVDDVAVDSENDADAGHKGIQEDAGESI